MRTHPIVSSTSAVFLLVLSAVATPLEARAAAAAPTLGTQGMVVSPQEDATRAGVDILKAGGNAVDAAVATALALGVTDPFHSGIGGGGFILIHLKSGKTIAIDGRETAPAAATRDMYVKKGVAADASKFGPLAVGTPGLVAGLHEAVSKHGRMSFSQVLQPAIRLAEGGFRIGPLHAKLLEYWKSKGGPERFPETARIQLPRDGKPARPGWRLVQLDLARSLKILSRQGPNAFYRGVLGKKIAEEVQKQGGALSYADFGRYELKRRKPIRGTYRGRTVLSFPPPSSGGIALVEMLNILEEYDLAARGAGSSASVHLITEAMKLAFADRAAYLGDADFVDVPTKELISREYAAKLRARINPPWWRRPPWTWARREVAIRVEGPGEPAAGGGTTHLSVADADGNAVAITQTINLLFGSGITVPGTGIILNDQMDDFSVAPGRPNAFGLVDTTGANAVAPGKRPLSSMSPTILLQDGKPVMVTGSPGGPRIITTTLLTILNVVDWGMDVSEAVAAPRFHHQWQPDTLRLERAFPADVVNALRKRGHALEVDTRNWSSAQAIVIDPKTGILTGGSDPRSDGIALGY